MLNELSFAVDAVTVPCTLGPNGSRKTPAVKAVTDLHQLDGDEARILGSSVIREAAVVQQLTGFSSQSAAVGEDPTTLENLVLVGVLCGLL